MERRLRVSSTHTAAVSALAYQPVRREFVTGHEDGTLKFWEGDTGRNTASIQQHKGWIADLYYWAEGKILFSCSVDGRVVLWSSSNQPYDSILVGEPVFSLLWVSRKSQLLLGAGRGLCALRKSVTSSPFPGAVPCVADTSSDSPLYCGDSDKGTLAANGLPLLSHRVVWLPGHTGIVRCLASAGNKVYTAGYDRKLMTSEVATLSGDGELPLKTVHINSAAHDAGITCLELAKDTDGSTWVVTGSFDKRVKLWTGDGKLVHIIQCSDTVTGICYVPQTRVLWIAAGTTQPQLYEPKSGDDVTDVVPVLDTAPSNHRNQRESVIQLLKYIPETNEVIGSTKLKELICWKCNPTCSVCCHQSPSLMHIETLTYTSKVPILIFSGSCDGEMTKWERLQLNPFLYSQDTLGYKDALLKALDSDDHSPWTSSPTLPANTGSSSHSEVTAQRSSDSGKGGGGKREEGTDNKKVDPSIIKKQREEVMKAECRGFVCSLFVESLDLLVASALDGNICVWGYDQHTVRVLQRMQQESLATDTSDSDIPTAAASGQNLTDKESSSVISRVAGFTCLHVLRGHCGCVQALTAVEGWTDRGTYLISGGWDLALCIWDLSTGSAMSCLRESLPSSHHPHPNLIITSIAYSPHRSEFAYATSDGQVLVRKFALVAEEMCLVRILDGHHSEVTQVCWNGVSGQWVTGSSDCTIRLWSGKPSDSDETEVCAAVGDPVSVVCVDQTTGHVVVAVQNILKVYNGNLELLQVSRGHSDIIRAIIHIPDRKEYVSCSWDGTVRVWRAYH